jgi:putative nucleotidyltransferase with HDIG domain
MFSAELIDAFAEVSRPEAFWLRLEPPYLLDYFEPWLRSEADSPELGFDSFHSMASLFSNCVDAKSEFTAEHSAGVARLAGQLGRWFGLSTLACQKLEIAGLLHDIGKLRVPDEILDKPGPLDGPERDVMERHSFDSQYILGRIGGLEDVALWASQHHEKLDGDGYPFRAAGAALSPEARILAVADIYQALAQDRPYRTAMPVDRILAVLRELASDGKVDGEIVDLVADHAESCYRLARGTLSASNRPQETETR